MAGLGEGVGRASGDGGRAAVLVQEKELRVCPCVGAVHGDVDGDVADDEDAFVVGVLFEGGPLGVKEVLLELIEHEVVVVYIVIISEGVFVAETDVFGPFVHAVSGEDGFDDHKERIVREPVPLLMAEG